MADLTGDSRDEDARTVIEARDGIPAARQRIDWRRGYFAADGLIGLLGVWLVISPFVLDYGSDDATWNPIVSGALLLAVAVAGGGGLIPRSAASWAVVAIAVWLFASGFWLADSVEASWNAWAAGGLACFLAIAAAAAASSEKHAAEREAATAAASAGRPGAGT